jgi:hypothetical protein
MKLKCYGNRAASADSPAQMPLHLTQTDNGLSRFLMNADGAKLKPTNIEQMSLDSIEQMSLDSKILIATIEDFLYENHQSPPNKKTFSNTIKMFVARVASPEACDAATRLQMMDAQEILRDPRLNNAFKKVDKAVLREILIGADGHLLPVLKQAFALVSPKTGRRAEVLPPEIRACLPRVLDSIQEILKEAKKLAQDIGKHRKDIGKEAKGELSSDAKDRFKPGMNNLANKLDLVYDLLPSNSAAREAMLNLRDGEWRAEQNLEVRLNDLKHIFAETFSIDRALELLAFIEAMLIKKVQFK